MYAIGVLYGDVQWKFPTKGKILSTATFSHDGEKIYFGSNDGNIYALKASTGTLLWKYQTNGGVVAAPKITAQGVLYVGSHDGSLYALDTTTNGTVVWKKDLGGAIFASAAIGEEKGAVYIGNAAENGPRVFALDANNGEVIWDFDKAGKIMSSPVLSSDGKV